MAAAVADADSISDPENEPLQLLMGWLEGQGTHGMLAFMCIGHHGHQSFTWPENDATFHFVGVSGFGRQSDKLSIFEADSGERGIIAIQVR